MRLVALFLILAAACGATPDSKTSTAPLTAEAEAFDALDRAPAEAHVHWMRGALGHGGPSNPSLVDHGGRVLASSSTYAIWWGNQSAFPADAQAGIATFLSSLNGTSFLGISGQYMRSAGIDTTFRGAYVDTSAPPKRGPGVSTIVNEACNVINANGLTADPSAVYFVFTSNFPHINYCAFHSYGTCNGVVIQVAYMPNITNIAGCSPQTVVNLACSTASPGLVALANTTSHELMEAITDATLTAWYDGSGEEVADKCAWQFSSCVALGGGTSWQLQQEWSNTAAGCVQE